AGLAGDRLEEHRGADGHADPQVVARAARHLVRAAGASALGGEVLAELEVEQRRQVVVGDEDHVAALPTVAAGWTAVRDELLAAPTDQPVAASPCADDDPDLVDEAHRSLRGGSGVSRRQRVDGDERLALVATLVEADRAVDQR